MSVGIDFTTTGLIKGAKLRACVPSSQVLFQDPEFITLLNNHMVSIVIPLIKSMNEEYFVVSSDSALVAGTSEYTIPTRALGGALRDIVSVDSSGRELELSRIAPESIKYSSDFQNNGAWGIYLKGDKVIFYPEMTNPPSGSYLRFKYERRPNDLCLVSNSGKILSINTGLNQIVLDRVPSTWGTATTLDIIESTPQFQSIKDDAVITNLSGTTITLSALPTGIAAGQYVSESLTTPIPQLPYEAHKLIEQLGAISLLEAMGDDNAKTSAKQTLKDMIESFLLIITPRIEGSPQKVVNKKSIFDAVSGRNNTFFTRP